MRSILARLSGIAAAVTVLVAAGPLVSQSVQAGETPAVAGNNAVYAVASLGNRTSDEHAIQLPEVLSVRDVARYQQIFALQEGGNWKQADAVIAQLEDNVLMGHVLEQRYMHPDKYRAKYKELKAWMAMYADLPQSQRVYQLALKRRPANGTYPAKPDLPKITYNAGQSVEPLPYRSNLTKAERREVRQLRNMIKRHTGRGQTLAAKNLVESDRVKKLFSNAQYDEVRAMLGFRYFIDGRDDWALQWAAPAADRSGHLVAEANWSAGLAAYRMGKLDDAARYFEALAGNDRASPWLASAGGFWAARSNLLNRNPAGVNPMLRLAAEHQRTFYGILARHVMGWDSGMEWQDPPLEKSAVEALADTPRGRRAIALVQVGQHQLAGKELRYQAVTATDANQAQGILSLATQANMPALSLRLDETLFTNSEDNFDNASYPLPSWKPEGGFTVDPALIFALIRQESKFNPKAKSDSGARGLMQLMPSTASFVASDRKYRTSSTPYLFEPALNMSLGQQYIEILRDDSNINGDLISMIAAWNGGPGNLNKWRRSMTYNDDPLLFIETIPSRETRIFVERVFANLWVYRDRLGQPAQSLDELARGQWPVYSSVEQPTGQVAEYDR